LDIVQKIWAPLGKLFVSQAGYGHGRKEAGHWLETRALQ